MLQRNDLASGLPQTVIAMISSNPLRTGHPSRVSIAAASSEGRTAGLRLDSIVMTVNLATVLEAEVESVLGRLPDLTKVDIAARHTLAL